MQRPIQFRVWDDRLLKFSYFDLTSAAGNLPIDCINNVQQFTGLRDVNGKWIFEGDIVKFQALNPSSRKPSYEEIIVVEWAEDFCGFNNFKDVFAEWEVLGNIFENSKLIKQ